VLVDCAGASALILRAYVGPTVETDRSLAGVPAGCDAAGGRDPCRHAAARPCGSRFESMRSGVVRSGR
jgi:hypothetical protein